MKCILVFLLAIVGPAWAQTETLGLKDALSRAEDRNPELKKLRATAERLSWTKWEALSGYIPHLTADYDHFFASKYMREGVIFGGALISFPAAYPQDSFTIDASWTVFDGFESWHKYKAAILNTEAASMDLSRARFQIDEAVRIAFYRALAAQKLVEVAHQNIKTLEEHLDRAHLTEQAGYGTRFDVLRIEATLEEAKAEAEQAEARLEDSRSALNEVMGEENDVDLVLHGDLPVPSESDVPRALSLSPSSREDLSAQTKREEASREMASASRAFWYPSISVFAEEQYYKFGSFDPVIQASAGYQNDALFGVRLKWNLFDGGYSYAKQKEASAAELESANETHKLLSKLPHEFETWKRGFFQSVSLYRARSRALAQYEESVRLAMIGVRAGTRTHTEVLDAELDLFRARAGLVKAQADAIEALGKLELALGHQIKDKI